MRCLVIKCKSADERSASIAALLAKGCIWLGDRDLSPGEVNVRYPYEQYPDIALRFSQMLLSDTDVDKTEVSLSDYLKRSFKPGVRAGHFNRYGVAVLDGQLAVGCQLFPHEKILELAKEIEQRRK